MRPKGAKFDTPVGVRVVVGASGASIKAAFLWHPPFGACGTTFPPLKRGHYGCWALCYMIQQVRGERFYSAP